MVWTQALLWLLVGIILGALFYNWLANIGHRHARVVSIGVCEDGHAPHLHITAIAVLEKAPLHEKTEVTMHSLKDPKPPLGFNELNWILPMTPMLRDSLASCLQILRPGRHPGRDYVAPFVVEHEGKPLVDIEMSTEGYTLNMFADAKDVDDLIAELLAAKEQLLLAPDAAEGEAVAEAQK